VYEDETTLHHKTTSSRIKIYYPFHPLCGVEVEIACKPKKGDGAITITDSQGIRMKIPSWMTDPECFNYKISDQSEISVRALFTLACFIESIFFR